MTDVVAVRYVSRNGWCLGWLAAAFGAAIIASHIESGRKRWSASAWSFALEVPGSPATWGAFVLAAGALILFGKRTLRFRTRIWGCRLAFWWFCALDAAAAIAFIEDPNNLVNPLSMVAWTAFAAMYRLHIADEQELMNALSQA